MFTKTVSFDLTAYSTAVLFDLQQSQQHHVIPFPALRHTIAPDSCTGGKQESD